MPAITNIGVRPTFGDDDGVDDRDARARLSTAISTARRCGWLRAAAARRAARSTTSTRCARRSRPTAAARRAAVQPDCRCMNRHVDVSGVPATRDFELNVSVPRDARFADTRAALAVQAADYAGCARRRRRRVRPRGRRPRAAAALQGRRSAGHRRWSSVARPAPIEVVVEPDGARRSTAVPIADQPACCVSTTP